MSPAPCSAPSVPSPRLDGAALVTALLAGIGEAITTVIGRYPDALLPDPTARALRDQLGAQLLPEIRGQVLAVLTGGHRAGGLYDGWGDGVSQLGVAATPHAVAATPLAAVRAAGPSGGEPATDEAPEAPAHAALPAPVPVHPHAAAADEHSRGTDSAVAAPPPAISAATVTEAEASSCAASDASMSAAARGDMGRLLADAETLVGTSTTPPTDAASAPSAVTTAGPLPPCSTAPADWGDEPSEVIGRALRRGFLAALQGTAPRLADGVSAPRALAPSAHPCRVVPTSASTVSAHPAARMSSRRSPAARARSYASGIQTPTATAA